MKTNRFKNYGLWVSLASLVLLVIQNFGIAIDAGKYTTVVNAILGILATLGVLNAPTTENKWYMDDKK